MFTYSRGNDQFTRRLNDRLRTTGLGLGLLRLQFDAGLTEEAKSTLAALQEDFQLLLHGLEGETEHQPAQPSTLARKRPRARKAEDNYLPFGTSAPAGELSGSLCGV